MIADIRPGAINDQLNAATVYQLYDLNVLVGTVLPGELDDRCVHVDATTLIVGNCVASVVLDPVSNAQGLQSGGLSFIRGNLYDG